MLVEAGIARGAAQRLPSLGLEWYALLEALGAVAQLELPWRQDLTAGTVGPRALEELDIASGLVGKSCVRPESGGRHVDREHAVGDTGALVGPRAAATGQRACGSVESRPSGSIRAPGGNSLPPLEATRTLPSATSEVAKSRIMGGCPGLGTPTTKGAVEMRRSTPPNGATSRLPATFTKCTETKPASAAIS